MREKKEETICNYCFNGVPYITLLINTTNETKTYIYDKTLTLINKKFFNNIETDYSLADNLINQSFVLSKKLSKDFNFVRVDWMIYKNKLYFEELTFTPYSGLNNELNLEFNEKMGNLLDLERF